MMTQCCELLAKEKLKVTFIKSASAGYLAYLFSLTPCSGKILIGGLVCYDLKVKEKILKISPKLIAKYTPESIEITEELVKKSKEYVYLRYLCRMYRITQTWRF
jgi:nicotinamide-nucleotide amidase